ncbi:MAG: hypothetical protein AAB336_04845 [Acidobacteriota bacterium]
MKKIKQFFINLFWTIFGGLLGSIICSLIFIISISAFYQSPFSTLIFTLLFIPFHLSDFQRFVREKEWLAFIGRFVSMLLISSFLVGFVKLSVGWNQPQPFFLPILIIAIPVIFILLTTYLFFNFFLPTSSLFIRFNNQINNVIRGGKVYGIFWDY